MRNARLIIEISQTDLPSEALILKKPGADKEAANAEKKIDAGVAVRLKPTGCHAAKRID